MKTMRDRGIILVRRRSGGGTVYHDVGNTNYSVMTSRLDFDKNKVSRWVVAALNQSFNLPAYYKERNDIWVNTRKVSGSAFKIASVGAYHHGTMLINADLANLEACLLPKNVTDKISKMSITILLYPSYSYLDFYRRAGN